MNNQKKLTKNTPFILYGGGEVGNNCYQNLTKQGYYVTAALDKNKSGRHVIEGLYTYKLGNEPKELDKKECVVMICLANGMIHKEVADNLYSLGYSYIIFLPMNHCIPDEQKHKLTILYNHVLLAELELTECKVVCYAQYAQPNIEKKNGIIKKTSKNITVWLRLEMLFSESLELWKGDKSKIHIKDEYEDKHIACANICEILFDFFALRIKSCDAYFDSMKEQFNWAEKEKELMQRENLYKLFKKEQEKGMAFFIEGAPSVIWNPNAYFNLVGGHHRTLYLLHEGHSLFPVKMQYDDFDKWYHEDVYKELKDYIYENHIERLYAPLPHPCFLNFPADCENVGRTMLADVMRFLADKDVSNMTVLDCSNDEGYFARNMDRIGVKETVFLNSDLRQIELADLFNRLLYREKVILKHEELKSILGGEQADKKYDIVFALNNIDETYVKLLGTICSKYLFMEITQSENIDFIKDCTGFNGYKRIHREYKNNQIRELVVFNNLGDI